MASPTAPTISATGIVAPTFAQIYAYLQGQYLAIFGADTDIDPDTQDGQLLAVFAQAISDANSAAVAVYNSFSPATAQGAGLSSNVQINGLSRLVPSFSVATVTINGTPGAVITNGQIIDQADVVWALPPTLTITPSGVNGSLATCQTAGAINVSGAFSINTPTFGWTEVTNTGIITVGAPVESDAALRVRQAQSVSLPSLTIFEGIVASIANTAGVTRVRGYENNTSSGLSIPGAVLPANNLDFVVEGGTAANIFQAIFEKITPGIPTWNAGGAGNNNSQVVTDANGSTRLLNYQTAIESTLNIGVTVSPLAGWSASTIPLIQAAVSSFYSVLQIGGNVSYFGLIPIVSLGGTPQAGTFEITALTINGATADIQLSYAQAISGSSVTTNVTVL
jgi:hypothetical protein